LAATRTPRYLFAAFAATSSGVKTLMFLDSKKKF
jgi:hypothetical protein